MTFVPLKQLFLKLFQSIFNYLKHNNKLVPQQRKKKMLLDWVKQSDSHKGGRS